MMEILRQVPLFCKMNDSQLRYIAEICTRKTYKAGTILFREKEPGSDFYIVQTGSVKLYLTSQGGEDKILSIFRAGESFGELSLIDGKPRSGSAQMLEDSSLIVLGADSFLGLLRANFDIALSVMQELAQRLRDTNQHVHDLTFLDARSRVVKNLILLANKNGSRKANAIHVKLALNFDEISRMAGVQKNVLMQVIRDLEDRRVLSVGIDEFVLHLDKLRGGS
ncbi:Crp/Fnr family transcriptional regulator [Paenibacillus hodogayensis]|uniref:Crp/Fnr family transcriptional regulator n=1 Tax=Paenibacillus hodogayensis TaxID=279208 RepID=A0ABV5VVW1_9BACL